MGHPPIHDPSTNQVQTRALFSQPNSGENPNVESALSFSTSQQLNGMIQPLPVIVNRIPLSQNSYIHPHSQIATQGIEVFETSLGKRPRSDSHVTDYSYEPAHKIPKKMGSCSANSQEPLGLAKPQQPISIATEIAMETLRQYNSVKALVDNGSDKNIECLAAVNIKLVELVRLQTRMIKELTSQSSSNKKFIASEQKIMQLKHQLAEQKALNEAEIEASVELEDEADELYKELLNTKEKLKTSEEDNAKLREELSMLKASLLVHKRTTKNSVISSDSGSFAITASRLKIPNLPHFPNMAEPWEQLEPKENTLTDHPSQRFKQP